MEETLFPDEWPRVSFMALANEEVEGRAVQVFYKSFFLLLRLPETMVSSLAQILKGK